MIETRIPTTRNTNKAGKIMNIIAIDIGNTNIKAAFYLDDREQFLRSIDADSPDAEQKLSALLKESWQRVPMVKGATEPVPDGVVAASSVKPEWTQFVEQVCKEAIGQKVLLIGRDIPLPMEMGVENPSQVGTDRVVTAAAAYAVIESAVVVADFGTAVTIDLVDEQGVFMGGVIAPGFAMGAKALHSDTAMLPMVEVSKPGGAYGTNTEAAINAGLYYSAAGLLEIMARKFAEELGRWPYLVVTGAGAELLRDECDFVDSCVPDLAVRGVVIAYKKYVFEKTHINELDAEDRQELNEAD